MADITATPVAADFVWGNTISWVGPAVPGAADNAFITVEPLSMRVNTAGGDRACTDLSNLSKLRIGDSVELACSGDVLFRDGSELYDESAAGTEGSGDGSQVLEIGDSFRIGEIRSSGVAGTLSSSPHLLTDATATFSSDGVTTADYVFIYEDGGGTLGSYAITSIDSETQLTLATDAGASSGDVHYQIRKKGTGDIENFKGWIKLTADLDNGTACGVNMGSVLSWNKLTADVRRWRHLWIAEDVEIRPRQCGAQTTNKGRLKMDAGSALLMELLYDHLFLYPEWNDAEPPFNIADDATIQAMSVNVNLPSGGATEEIDLGGGGTYITSALTTLERGVRLRLDSDDDASRAHTYVISGAVTVTAGRYNLAAIKNTGGQSGHTVRLDGGFTAPVLAIENWPNDGAAMTLEINSAVRLGELLQGATCLKTLAFTLKLTGGTLTITDTLDLLGTKLTGAVSGTGTKLILDPTAGATLTVNANSQSFGDVSCCKGDIELTASDTMAVTGRFTALGSRFASTTGGTSTALTLSQDGRAVGGSFKDIDCSGGNRLVAYGSKDLGGNSNIAFYGARGNRAVMMMNRRAYQTGLV